MDRPWAIKKNYDPFPEEWPEMNGSDRMRFALPVSVARSLGAFLVVGGLYVGVILGKKQSLDDGALIILAVFLFPIGCGIPFRVAQIIRSMRRYTSRESISAA
jgi:hypothetical protein